MRSCLPLRERGATDEVGIFSEGLPSLFGSVAGDALDSLSIALVFAECTGSGCDE